VTIDFDRLMTLDIPAAEQAYSEKDVVLYALGIGVGLDGYEPDLCYVNEGDLKVFPTFGAVAAHPGLWVRDLDTGLDWVRVVHAEHGVTFHRPFATAGIVTGRTRVVDVIDKGPGRGALVYSAREVFDTASGELLATVRQTTLCRGDGGFGGPPRPQPRPHSIPDRAADMLCEMPTSLQSALIYRLSGDYNPIHIDPSVAASAGFARPILHGLASFGLAARALVRCVCNDVPERLASIDLRFTATVFPGETLRTHIWCEDGVIAFRLISVERDAVVIDNGRATLK
jgi:acyl dehydratase